jgi:hypothetical protein
VGNGVNLPTSEAYQIAKRFYPAWRKCSSALHACNVQAVSSAGLNDPVDEIICWTANEITAIAICLAQAFGIKVRNLCLVQVAFVNKNNLLSKFWLIVIQITPKW